MSLILPLIRLNRDDERGLKPEVTSMVQINILRYEYSCWKLAKAWIDKKLAYTDLKLPEMDDESISLTALTLKSSVHDLSEVADILGAGRIETSFDPYCVSYGYDIAPSGLTEAFGGYDITTLAWVVPNKNGPALLFRKADDIEELMYQWLTYWAETLDFKKPWPTLTDETKTIVIPECYLAMMRQKRRKVRSFLVRSH